MKAIGVLIFLFPFPLLFANPVNSTLNWGPCQGINNSNYQCASLTIPLNYNNPHPGNTQIEVIKYQQPDVSSDNILVINLGGPWDTGTSTLPVMISLMPPALLSHFTIVDFDPRGVGQSQNLNCTSKLFEQLPDINFATNQGMNELIQINQQLGQTCAPQYGGFQNYMGTMNTAKDLDQIRQALKVNQISYVGYSYGTELGSLYLSMYPSHVRAMVLDGNTGPSRDFEYIVMESADAYENTLNTFFADCDANQSCPLYPNAAAQYDQVVAKLAISPAPTGEPGDNIPLTLAHFYFAVSSTLAFTGMNPNTPFSSMWGNYLAQGIKAINENNDGSILGSLFAQANAGPGNDTNNMTYQAVLCSDLGNQPDTPTILADAQAMQEKDPRIGAYVGGNLLADCAGWPATPQPLPNLAYPANMPPVILIGNLSDPETNYIFSQQMQETIPNSTLITWTGAGHTAFLTNEPPGTCIQNQVENYLLNLTPPDQELCDDVINPTTPFSSTSTTSNFTKAM